MDVMVRSVLLVLCTWSLVQGYGHKKSYTGYHVLSMMVRDADDVRFLHSMRLDRKLHGLDLLTEPALLHDVKVLVPPSLLDDVTQSAEGRGMDIRVVTDDLQGLMDEEMKSTPDHVVRQKRSEGQHVIDHYKYHPYSKMQSYLRKLADMYPKNMEITDLQMSTYEGKDILLAKLQGKTRPQGKPSIIIEAGVHAREWIASAVNLYAIEKLLQDYASGEETARLMLDNLDWYIVPLFNPDGYEYSINTDRLWRKNRHVLNDTCVGVDINRNFDIAFERERRHKDCDNESYKGPKAFSEQESQAMRRLVHQLRDSLKIYLAVHSFGQFALVPWSYETSDTSRPDNSKELDRVGHLVTAALSSKGHNYTYGASHALLHYAPVGTSVDWVLAELPGLYSYTWELRPEYLNEGVGFVLNADQIVPTAQEYYAGLVALVKGAVTEPGL